MASNKERSDIYAQLEQFCETDQHREMLKLLKEGYSQAEVAKALGIGGSTLERRLNALKSNLQNPSKLVGNFEDPIKAPLVIKGISTFYDNASGEAIRTWVKTDVDKTRQLKMILESFEISIKGYKSLEKVKAPKRCSKDTLPIIPLGDPHIGMYSWAEETGEDFDCEIAERDLRAAMAYLIDKTPPSETCLILNLGDFFHSDNQSNRTARAGNALDVDTRWARVLQIGITLMVDCINLSLEKHKKVIVKNNIETPLSSDNSFRVNPFLFLSLSRLNTILLILSPHPLASVLLSIHLQRFQTNQTHY